MTDNNQETKRGISTTGEDVRKVEPPDIVNPANFYERKGKRPVFVPIFLAKYLEAYLYPVCSTDGIFYQYKDGVWQALAREEILRICVFATRGNVHRASFNAVIQLLSDRVNREEEEWPHHSTLINFKNGMLDIGENEFIPHDPQWGSRIQIPISYNPEAGASMLWNKFLEEIFPDDPDASKRMLLQQYFGYCLIRDCRYQQALFLYGTGANGKSVVLKVLSAMVGEENTSSLTLQDLSKPFRIQVLQNKLANISNDTSPHAPVAMEIFKQVVDGDVVLADRKYGEPFQYRPFAKWLVAMNEAPTIPDKLHGLTRRVVVLNLNRRFLPEEIKPKIEEQLITEIDRILNWAVDGLYTLLDDDRFFVGPTVMADTNKFLEAMNPLLSFVSECCEVHEGIHESTINLWNAYKAWCAEEGKIRPLSRNKFYEQILATSTQVRKRRPQEDGEKHRFDGIRLTPQGREYAEKGNE